MSFNRWDEVIVRPRNWDDGKNRKWEPPARPIAECTPAELKKLTKQKVAEIEAEIARRVAEMDALRLLLAEWKNLVRRS